MLCALCSCDMATTFSPFPLNTHGFHSSLITTFENSRFSYVCVCACVCVYVCVCVCVCIHVAVPISAKYALVSLHIHNTHIYTHIHTHTHTYTHKPTKDACYYIKPALLRKPLYAHTRVHTHIIQPRTHANAALGFCQKQK
jgi:hypothetical protein